jgi:hypothetical protein
VTPLQVYTRALGDLLRDAREKLDDEAYTWFVETAVEHLGTEAARLFLGEALRALREEDAA